MVLFLFLALPAMAQLRFEKRALELHSTFSDTQVVAEFRFRNEGNRAIKLVGLTSSCGCTEVNSEKRFYGPGEAGTIKAVLTVGDRVGEQRKSVFVDTDCPEQERIELQFTTTIPPWAELEPKFLKWKVEERLAPKSLIAKIAPGQVSVTATPSSKAVETKLEPLAGEGNFRLTVTPKEGKLRALVTLKGEYPNAVSKVATVFINVP